MIFWADEELCFSDSPSSVSHRLRIPACLRCNPDFVLIGLGTTMCGLAPSMEALIAARAIAGMGGGGFVMVQLTTFYGQSG